MTIVAIEISSFDSTCLSAAVNRVGSDNFFDENFHQSSVFVPVPQELVDRGIKKAEIISRKSEDIVFLEFHNGESLKIKKISEDENPQVAIKEAIEDFEFCRQDPLILENWLTT